MDAHRQGFHPSQVDYDLMKGRITQDFILITAKFPFMLVHVHINQISARITPLIPTEVFKRVFL